MSLKQKMACRKNLLEEGHLSDSDNESIEEYAGRIQPLLLELIPAYYQYRSQLQNILKEDCHHLLPREKDQAVLDAAMRNKCQGYQKALKAKKEYEESHSIQESGRNFSRGRERTLITQRVIEQFRKKQQQERDLLSRYELQDETPRLQNFQIRDPLKPPGWNTIQKGVNQGDFAIFNGQSSGGLLSDSKKTSCQPPMASPIEQQQQSYQIICTEDSRGPRQENGEKVERAFGRDTHNFNQGLNSERNMGENAPNKQIMQSYQQLKSEGDFDEIKSPANGRSLIVPPEQQYSHELGTNLGKGKHKIVTVNATTQHHSYEEVQLKDKQPFHKQADPENGSLFSEEDTPGRIDKNRVKMGHEDTHSERNNPNFPRQSTQNWETQSEREHNDPYFENQRKKIERQKKYVEELHQRVSEVLGESNSRDPPQQMYSLQIEPPNTEFRQFCKVRSADLGGGSSTKVKQSEGGGLRFILEELCELWSVSECFKYYLKNKQYSILERMSGEEVMTGPISFKTLYEGSLKILAEADPDLRKMIIQKIFGQGSDCLTFEEFGACLKSKFNEAQIGHINIKVSPANPHNISQSLQKLFTIYAEIIYFEEKLRQLIIHTPKEVQNFHSAIDPEHTNINIDVSRFQEFVFKTTGNRANKLRISVFLQNSLRQPSIKEMLWWLRNGQNQTQHSVRYKIAE